MKEPREDRPMQGSEDDGSMLTQAGTSFMVRAVSRDTV